MLKLIGTLECNLKKKIFTLYCSHCYAIVGRDCDHADQNRSRVRAS